MRHIIYPYNIYSQSAKALSNGLKGVRVYPNKNYTPRLGDVVINWGMSQCPKWHTKMKSKGLRYLNTHIATGNSSNKIKAFKLMRAAGVNIPQVTTSLDTAKDWGKAFIGRTIISGHGGAGCFYYKKDAVNFEEGIKFCTEYIRKTAEYRVHVFNGKIIDVQEKRKRLNLPEEFKVNFQVRNHEMGWVFCRENVNADQKVVDEAQKAVKALKLDFGAVDVVWNKVRGAYILEVNTSPGLEGTTLENYVNAFKKYLEVA